MTAEVTTGSTTVGQDVPPGIFRRLRRRSGSSPPVVIEVRIDVTGAGESTQQASPSAPKLTEAIEAAAGGKSAGGLPLLVEKVGGAVADRVDAVIGMTGTTLEQRIDEMITGVNSQIDQLVENAVNEAVNAVVHRVIEERLQRTLDEDEIDLTKLEGQSVTAQEGADRT